MLDTNTVSHFLRGQPKVIKRLLAVPMSSLCISAITEGELHFGLARRPEAKQFRIAVNEFLLRVETLPWDSIAAQHYGNLRSNLEKRGKVLSPNDMMIASHALSVEAILVTNDKAFRQVKDLAVEDWTV
jgi:tRNA(fMet)-specific endonuclease VapC